MSHLLTRLTRWLRPRRTAAAPAQDTAARARPTPTTPPTPRPPPPTPGPGSWHCGVAGQRDLGTRGGTNKHVWHTAVDDAVVLADGSLIELPVEPVELPVETGWQEVAPGVFVNRVPADHVCYVAARPTSMPAKLRSRHRIEVHYSDSSEFNQDHLSIEFRPLGSTPVVTPDADDHLPD